MPTGWGALVGRSHRLRVLVQSPVRAAVGSRWPGPVREVTDLWRRAADRRGLAAHTRLRLDVDVGRETPRLCLPRRGPAPAGPVPRTCREWGTGTPRGEPPTPLASPTSPHRPTRRRSHLGAPAADGERDPGAASGQEPQHRGLTPSHLSRSRPPPAGERLHAATQPRGERHPTAPGPPPRSGRPTPATGGPSPRRGGAALGVTPAGQRRGASRQPGTPTPAGACHYNGQRRRREQGVRRPAAAGARRRAAARVATHTARSPHTPLTTSEGEEPACGGCTLRVPLGVPPSGVSFRGVAAPQALPLARCGGSLARGWCLVYAR